MISRQTHRTCWLTGLLTLASLLTFNLPVTAQEEGDRLQAEAEEQYREAQQLYREAQQLLNEENYQRAARSFARVQAEYAESRYAAEALYWQAFALYREGGKQNLRRATQALELQREQYAKARSKEDAEALLYRVYGKLAEQGDAQAARWIAENAEKAEAQADQDLEIKLAALHALVNMKSERAVPILEKILQDRDPAKSELRQQAIYLLAQHLGEGSPALLMDLARNDPDPEVREMAVFWLAQSDADEVVPFLEEMLFQSENEELSEYAIHALAQMDDERAAEILKRVSLDERLPHGAREHAIYWLGHQGSDEHLNFLMELYAQVDDQELKENLLHGVAQSDRADERVTAWFMKIIFDESEDIELRQTALFWAGQQGKLNPDELADLYHQVEDPEMREQVIYVLSQRDSADAFDVLLDLAGKEGNHDLRQQLIFWIGQSDDPRAEEFILKILEE
jgi:HEAT repeat protein